MTTVKGRLYKFIEHKMLTVKQFEVSCGLSNGYVSSIRKSIGEQKLSAILRKYEDLNRDWLLFGDGPMIICGNSDKDAEIPVIPTELHKEPGVNLYQYTEEYPSRTSPVVQQFSQFDRFFCITNDSMAPRLLPSDFIAIQRVEDFTMIIPGAIYMIDTKQRGALVRKVFPKDGGFVLRTYNPSDFPDFEISLDEIYNISRVVGLIRTNI